MKTIGFGVVPVTTGTGVWVVVIVDVGAFVLVVVVMYASKPGSLCWSVTRAFVVEMTLP